MKEIVAFIETGSCDKAWNELANGAAAGSQEMAVAAFGLIYGEVILLPLKTEDDAHKIIAYLAVKMIGYQPEDTDGAFDLWIELLETAWPRDHASYSECIAADAPVSCIKTAQDQNIVMTDRAFLGFSRRLSFTGPGIECGAV